MIRKYYITDKQNAIDIAILNYGEADRVFELIKINKIGLEHSLNKGGELILPEVETNKINEKLLAHFEENNIKIATDINNSGNFNAGYSYGFTIGFNS